MTSSDPMPDPPPALARERTVQPESDPVAVDTVAADMLAEAKDEIDRADQKASLLIGSLGIAFSIVLSGMIGGSWGPSHLSAFGAVLWAVGVVIAAASLLAAALAVWPRLSKGPGPGAITYWGQVRGMRSPEEVAAALATRGLLPPQRTYQQLLVLSAVVQRKYRAIRWAMVLAGVGTALVAMSFLFTR